MVISYWGFIGVENSMGGLMMEMVLFMLPIWAAFVVGLAIGWSWRPNWWPILDRMKFDGFMSKIVEYAIPSSCKGFPSIQRFTGFNLKACGSSSVVEISEDDSFGDANCSSSQLKGEEPQIVNEADLVHLCRLVEERDGGLSWIQMMDRSTATMSYKAWRRDPENGPPQYRSSTIFEDATPEMVRDFFWDDEFRPKWDNMLIHAKIIQQSSATGTMIVQWVRKFPFFCSDREYIIGRRIWESERTYYCVTKGVPCPSIPRRDKPRRVDLYYSSWCIRPVESKRGSGQMTACEVLLFHHEDMGIPWEIAKLGVRQGMWGAVKKINPGLHAYQKTRATGSPLSSAASMAHITTKVSPQHLSALLSSDANGQSQSAIEVADPEEKKQVGMNIPKLLVIGGAAVLACSLDRGLLTKAVIFGVARRIGRIGGKL